MNSWNPMCSPMMADDRDPPRRTPSGRRQQHHRQDRLGGQRAPGHDARQPQRHVRADPDRQPGAHPVLVHDVVHRRAGPPGRAALVDRVEDVGVRDLEHQRQHGQRHLPSRCRARPSPCGRRARPRSSPGARAGWRGPRRRRTARPSGRNAVQSVSSPSIQSPPFSISVTRLCRLSTAMSARTCMSRVRQPISSRR